MLRHLGRLSSSSESPAHPCATRHAWPSMPCFCHTKRSRRCPPCRAPSSVCMQCGLTAMVVKMHHPTLACARPPSRCILGSLHSSLCRYLVKPYACTLMRTRCGLVHYYCLTLAYAASVAVRSHAGGLATVISVVHAAAIDACGQFTWQAHCEIHTTS